MQDEFREGIWGVGNYWLVENLKNHRLLIQEVE